MIACSMNFSSPSFMEMEFTMHLPCTHFNPASMISNLEQSIMIGIFAISGSLCNKVQESGHCLYTIQQCIIHIHIQYLCAAFYLLPCNAQCFFIFIFPDKTCKFLEPVTLVRSPTFTKFVSGRTTNGSNPESRKIRFYNNRFLHL